jgi:TatD DNase family protein
VQRVVLQRQLALCSRFDLPAVIHSRDAQAATWEILEPWARSRRRDGGSEPFGVMHCYAYDLEAAFRYVELGFMISIPGTVTYPSNRRGQEVARGLPSEALVIVPLSDAAVAPRQAQRAGIHRRDAGLHRGPARRGAR